MPRVNKDLLGDAVLMWLKVSGVRVVEVVDKGWEDSDSEVLRVTADDGRRFFLKQFASPRKFTQAVNAYSQWLDRFYGQVPQLVSANFEMRLLLLSDLGDCCCSWQALTPAQQTSLLFQAGVFLRRLHGTAVVEDDLMPAGDAVLVRAQSLGRKIEETTLDITLLPSTCMVQVVREIEEISTTLNQIGRVPCHRDFWKRNWIWRNSEDHAGAGIQLGVFDFEHARPDVFLFDFMKLWAHCWLERPHLEQPFWDGYGRCLSDMERCFLRRCASIHAVQTIVWATEHSQDDFVAQGRSLLTAAMDDAKQI